MNEFMNISIHYRDKLHAGIARDVQHQEERKFENLYILEQQRELTEKLRENERKAKEEVWTAEDWKFSKWKFVNIAI